MFWSKNRKYKKNTIISFLLAASVTPLFPISISAPCSLTSERKLDGFLTQAPDVGNVIGSDTNNIAT